MIFLVLCLYLETIYHLFCFGSKPVNLTIALGILIIIAGVESYIISFFHNKLKKLFIWIFMILDVMVYAVQLVYFKIFKQPLLISAVIYGTEDAITNYWKEALYAIVTAGIPILLMIFPLVLYGMYLKKRRLKFEKRKLKKQQNLKQQNKNDESKKQQILKRKMRVKRKIALAGGVSGVLIFLLSLSLGDENDAFSTEVYWKFTDPSSVFEQFGVAAGMQRNTHCTIFGNRSSETFLEVEDNENLRKKKTADKKREKWDTSPNVLPIDFAALNAKENRKEIQALHQFVEKRTPTRKNKYTGMFKDYNLIYLTAEGFAPYCVDETLTPTLYKLLHSGFQFKNYYVPLWQTSTSDGEFSNCTGLLPDNQFSFRRSAENSMPFVLPAFFKEEGVSSYGYHNNSLSYYARYRTHENMGYRFKAGSLGKLSEAEWGDHIFKMEHPKAWPQSDLEMMQATMQEYIDQPRFHTYYMTVSGHLQYTFSGNAMSAKNKELVKDLPYSEKAKAYIACNIEFDRALEYVINELEKAGKLDNTVICFGADHYPYGLEKTEIEELRGEPLQKPQDIYRNGLVVWNSKMKPVVVEKPCSSVDIVPTLLNLFGFEYDSRLYSGQDILSDSDPLVVFADRSFLTDQVYYNAKTKQAESQSGKSVDEAYVERMKKQVQNLFTFSAGVLDYDYYKTLEEYAPDYK